jgi:hypothetical protein
MSAIGGPASAYYISEVEQDRITAVVLEYAMAHPGYLSNLHSMDLYLLVRGEDPAKGLLAELQKYREKFKPESASRRDSNEKRIVFHVKINTFVATGPTIAAGTFSAICGNECGEQCIVSVRKISTKWSVASFRATTVE